MNKVVVMEQPSIKQDCSKIKVDLKIIPTRLQGMTLIVRNPCCSVYKGVYNGETVAVKLFELENRLIQAEDDDVALRREIFTEEVSVWRELHHPNITKFVGEIRDDLASKVHHQLPKNTLCCGIVMEYLCHGTLRRHIELTQKKEKKLPLKQVIKLALDLAQGLEYLHSKNIVHRDVKTENLLLDETNVLKITDFGTAIKEDPNSKSLCSRVGTIRYMAPEVLSKEKYDRKCDVFSFGICLWEIYCCETPYAVLSPFELECDDIMKNKRPEIPKKCPKSIARIMKSCWEEDTNRRPEMKEIVVMLKKMKASQDKPIGCFNFL